MVWYVRIVPADIKDVQGCHTNARCPQYGAVCHKKMGVYCGLEKVKDKHNPVTMPMCLRQHYKKAANYHTKRWKSVTHNNEFWNSKSEFRTAAKFDAQFRSIKTGTAKTTALGTDQYI